MQNGDVHYLDINNDGLEIGLRPNQKAFDLWAYIEQQARDMYTHINEHWSTIFRGCTRTNDNFEPFLVIFHAYICVQHHYNTSSHFAANSVIESGAVREYMHNENLFEMVDICLA